MFLPPLLSIPLFRRGLSGGLGVPQELGYAVLDELHNLHHHAPLCGSDPLGGRGPAHGGQHVRRRPPQSIRPRRVSEVRTNSVIHIQLELCPTPPQKSMEIGRILCDPRKYDLVGGGNEAAICQNVTSIYIPDLFSLLKPHVLDQLERAVSQYHACHPDWFQCPCDHWQRHPNP